MSNNVDLEKFIDELIERAGKKGFTPKILIDMRDRYDTVGAIKRLVISKEISKGLKRLEEIDLLDWSIEAAVLKFPGEFTPEEQDAARWKLEQMGAGSVLGKIDTRDASTARTGEVAPPHGRITSEMNCVFLVSCGKNKKPSAAPARELYISGRFQRTRASVEATGCPWFVLSAKHGLLAPDKVIDPYDKTLNGKPLEARKAWAEKVKGQMDDNLPHAEIIVILAGKYYYEYLIPYLNERFANVMIPVDWFEVNR